MAAPQPPQASQFPPPPGYHLGYHPQPLSGLLQLFGPNWLNDHEYINFTAEQLASADPHYYLDRRNRRTAKWKLAHFVGRPHTPALSLASRFLDEPLMLPFFEGIMDRAAMTILIDPNAKATTLLNANEILRKFELANTPDAAAQLVVWQKIRGTST